MTSIWKSSIDRSHLTIVSQCPLSLSLLQFSPIVEEDEEGLEDGGRRGRGGGGGSGEGSAGPATARHKTSSSPRYVTHM